MSDIIIVGAGFFGATVAERIAADLDQPVTLIDRRPHIGGNCWSETDPVTGVEVHTYGSHIFHTSDQEVWNYIKRFSDFNDYRHVVWTTSRGRVFPMPINLATINSFYSQALLPDQARELIRRESSREGLDHPGNLEEKAVSLIGRPLYEAFIKGYTIKQWEKDPTLLSPDIITRLPVRYNYNLRYFSDAYEGLPLNGYGQLFGRLLEHKNIQVSLKTEWTARRDQPHRLVVYTGGIDEFFDYELGRLDWRTLDFQCERLDRADFQGVAVMNWADPDIAHTRVHEFKHYHPERPDTGRTFIAKEFSRTASSGDQPYYPVPTQANQRLYEKYMELARARAPQVIFGGRLGQYKYLDMDDTIAEALHCYQDQIKPRLGV